ncbi:MAG: hypothetical protein KAQ71_12970, partial [Desulfobulbaceae bacterium]|nr:hypothetical protein [Desulfobulbaceae bacterium]
IKWDKHKKPKAAPFFRAMTTSAKAKYQMSSLIIMTRDHSTNNCCRKRSFLFLPVHGIIKIDANVYFMENDCYE